MPIYRKLNRNFFKKWSQDMAYVLGFFVADGSMIKSKRYAHYIEFHSIDREIIEKIKFSMDSDHKISHRKPTKITYSDAYRLQLGSKEMFEDLLKLGMTQNKSLTLNFPSVPDKFLSNFIRGYFDGDGCISFGKYKCKDRKNPRWMITVRFTSGSKKFLIALHNKLGNICKGGFITKKNRGHELIYSFKDSLALYKFMYNNVPALIYMERKYKKFNKALKALNMRV
jgi:hypothetical protein